MNLIDIIRRRDPLQSSASPDLVPCDYAADEIEMRGVFFPLGSSVVLSDIFSWDEFRVQSVDIGLKVCRIRPSTKRKRFAGQMELVVELKTSSNTVRELARVNVTEAERRWRTVEFKWPWDMQPTDCPDLVFRCEAVGAEALEPKDGLVLGVRSALDPRQTVIEQARGRGVELGPGPYPRILSSLDTDVLYYETSPIEELGRRYERDNKTAPSAEQIALWKTFSSGDGQKLSEITPRSLDFIFSSHVFEHMVNPLGTLELWKTKLREGGCVLGIVPNANNIFDAKQPLSTVEQWLNEWREGVWDLQSSHFEKWCAFTHPSTEPSYWSNRKFSIHVHYYSQQSFSNLLEIAKRELGFQSYLIQSGPNFKEFVFLLRA